MEVDPKQLLDEAARHYDIPNDFERINIKLASRLICPLCAGKDVLEIGCASGEMSEDLVACSKSLTIVEPVESFCANMRERLGSSVTVYNCFLEEMRDHRQYDVIIMGSLLHHIKEPLPFLESVRKFCRKNTEVVATVPNVGSLHRRVGVKAGMINDLHDNTERNIRYHQFGKFNHISLEALFSQAGFTVKECFGYMLKPFSSEQMMSLKLDDKILDALFEIGREFPQLSSQLYIRATVK